MEYEFADNNNGVIMPNIARVGDNGNYSVFVYNTSLKIQDVTVYAGNGSGNNSGIEFSSFAQGKIDNVSFVNCYNGVRAYVQSKVHCTNTKGTTSSYAFYSLSGSDISLSATTQVQMVLFVRKGQHLIALQYLEQIQILAHQQKLKLSH